MISFSKNHWAKILGVLVLVVFLVILGWKRWEELSCSLLSDTSFWDHYGSIIGGLLSFISVLLLAETLKEQKKSSDEAHVNNLFFELLKYLQTEISDLNISKEIKDGRIIRSTNKDFFEVLRRDLQDEFLNTKNYQRNRERAKKEYLKIYAQNLRIGAYLRILYRICDLIDNSSLENDKKRDYIKIVRSQLTDAELLIIKYNGMTEGGKKFKHYINKYNILKHLRLSEFLEFKDWMINLSPSDKNDISQFYFILRDTIKRAEKDGAISSNLINLGNWNLKIERPSHRKLYVRLIRSDNKSFCSDYRFLDILTPERVRQLLQCILAELFIYSSYELIHKKRETKLGKDASPSSTNIHCYIESINQKTLTLISSNKLP